MSLPFAVERTKDTGGRRTSFLVHPSNRRVGNPARNIVLIFVSICSQAAEAEASTTEAQAGPTALGPQLPAAAAPHNGNKKPAPAKPAIKPTIKVKAKAPAAAAGVVTAGAAAIAASSSGREGGAQAPDAKRQKLEEGGNKGVKAAAKAGGSGAAAAPVPAPSLAGLLGGYGSDSDDGSGSGSD